MIEMLAQLENLVVVDVETTGINPFSHQLTAVALLPLHTDAAPKVVYVRPTELTWTPTAKVYFERYSTEWEARAVEPRAACNVIEKYLFAEFGAKTATLVGHNIAFDAAFLRQLANMSGRDQLRGISHRCIDTHTLLFLLHLKGIIPPEALTSDGAFEYFDIRIPDQLRHTAAGDVSATKALLERVLRELGVPIAVSSLLKTQA